MRGLHCVTLCYLYKYGAAREIVCACYGGLPAMVTVAFLRCAGAIRERRMTPNQKIWIPAHRCLSTCCLLEVYEGVVAGDVVVVVVLVMGGRGEG